MGNEVSTPCKVRDADVTNYIVDKNHVFGKCVLDVPMSYEMSPAPAHCTETKPCLGQIEYGKCHFDTNATGIACASQIKNNVPTAVPLTYEDANVQESGYDFVRFDLDKVKAQAESNGVPAPRDHSDMDAQLSNVDMMIGWAPDAQELWQNVSPLLVSSPVCEPFSPSQATYETHRNTMWLLIPVILTVILVMLTRVSNT